jgi:hypothetical protein
MKISVLTPWNRIFVDYFVVIQVSKYYLLIG